MLLIAVPFQIQTLKTHSDTEHNKWWNPGGAICHSPGTHLDNRRGYFKCPTVLLLWFNTKCKNDIPELLCLKWHSSPDQLVLLINLNRLYTVLSLRFCAYFHSLFILALFCLRPSHFWPLQSHKFFRILSEYRTPLAKSLVPDTLKEIGSQIIQNKLCAPLYNIWFVGVYVVCLYALLPQSTISTKKKWNVLEEN